MTVTSGLSDYQVLQRGRGNAASIRASGKCKTADGDVLVRVRKEKKPATTLLEVKAGKATRGCWSARVDGIPLGGEYAIEFSIRKGKDVLARASKRHLVVGDIWVLAGQSNMVGGATKMRIETPSRWLRVFDMADRWGIAREPLHRLLEARDEAYHPGYSMEQLKEQAKRERSTFPGGGGLGLTFAKEINRATGIPIGLIPAAKGGTEIAEWSPSLKKLGGKSLYGALIRKIGAAGGRIKGILWYQGESDSWGNRAARYRGRFKHLIESLRSDIGQVKLPFLYVQLSRVLLMPNLFDWNLIQDVQRRIEGEVPCTGFVASVDLPLDDVIHLNAKAQVRLGRRLANLARRIVYGDRSVNTGPRLERIRFLDSSKTGLALDYSGVNGGLHPKQRISGFSIWKGPSRLPIIVESSVDEKKPNRVILILAEPFPDGAKVMYGFGTNPYCNLVDELDMAAPVFLPVEPRGYA